MASNVIKHACKCIWEQNQNENTKKTSREYFGWCLFYKMVQKIMLKRATQKFFNIINNSILSCSSQTITVQALEQTFPNTYACILHFKKNSNHHQFDQKLKHFTMFFLARFKLLFRFLIFCAVMGNQKWKEQKVSFRLSCLTLTDFNISSRVPNHQQPWNT